MSDQDRTDLVRKPPIRRAFHSIAAPEGQYQCDIVFVQYGEGPTMKKINDNMTCLLLVVEVATRFAYMVALQNKKPAQVCPAFEKIYGEIINSGRWMLSLTHDAGKEFDNATWNKMIADLPTKFSAPPIKEYIKEPGDRYSLGTIDSLCRTFKRFLEDYMIKHQSLEWVKALPQVVKQYNEHQIGIRDSDKKVVLRASPKKLHTYGRTFKKAQEIDIERGKRGLMRFHQFTVGDTVRIRLRPGDQPRAISRLAKPGDLAKGADRWSNLVYLIDRKEGFSFDLKEKTSGKKATRSYRAHELLKVDPTSSDVPDIFAKVASQSRQYKRMRREDL